MEPLGRPGQSQDYFSCPQLESNPAASESRGDLTDVSRLSLDWVAVQELIILITRIGICSK